MRATLGTVLLAGLVSASFVSAAMAADDGVVEAMAKASWRHDIAQKAAPSSGCYHATYPGMVWQRIACKAATSHIDLSQVPFAQAKVQAAGSGDDYVLHSASHLISKAVGSFPVYSGVTSLKSGAGANQYALQMNTGMYSSAACAGHSGCTVWQQFFYVTDFVDGDEAGVFMQDWLINYGSSSCPSGFVSDGEGDCYKDSAAAPLANIKPKSLGGATLTGTATTGGDDTVVITYDGDAYSSSQKDSALDIASVWNEVEYNIFGVDGEAQFNSSGVSIEVNVAVDDGATVAPSCVADGSSGMNNLTLGSCTAAGGTTPSISFTESD